MGTSPYGKRDLVAVTPFAGLTWKYGFYTNTTQAQRDQLGQVAAAPSGNYIAGLVLGANSPQPTRVKKYRTGGGFDSTFCDVAKINDARTAGWSIVKRAKRRMAGTTPRSKTVFITIAAIDAETGQPEGSQIKYAWKMPLSLYNLITGADRSALGIQDATANDNDLVFGARYPSPPRATFTAVTTEGYIGHRTTFCDPSKLDSLPSGWAAADTSGYV